jgi:hypothetical protein
MKTYELFKQGFPQCQLPRRHVGYHTEGHWTCSDQIDNRVRVKEPLNARQEAEQLRRVFDEATPEQRAL